MLSRRSLAIAVGSLLLAAAVRVNLTPSLPRGLYLRVPASTTSGALVALCLPPAAGALYRAHTRTVTGSCPDRLPPFLKAIAARGGQTVFYSAEGLAVAGETLPLSAPRAVDAVGRALPHAPYGTYRLAPGTVWLYAPHPDSFDSRYLGPLAETNLLYGLIPIWLVSPPPRFCHLGPFSSRLEWNHHA